ncbi:OLC1v1031912C1 [Oldenlandia corymbosa var. corymbosa]|uniref:OLC1v1031912C1 n=1 Tax=Oldenlandia corymbosa var. corymbosa TaxID=529605 RepID=A0AAV1CMW3_OLDCO|nr:OLC1v1031912C1 [Oldenlandia corymbosa var. corymbosa]
MSYTTLLGRIAVVCLVGQAYGDLRHGSSAVMSLRHTTPVGYFANLVITTDTRDVLLLTAAEISSLLKRKPFGGSDRRWLQQLGIYLQVWNDRHGQVVGTDDLYVGEPSADPEYLLWYHRVLVKYVTDPTDSKCEGFHGSRDLAPHGQRTFDADSFGYDRLGEIAQVAERALSVNATNVVRHDLDRHVEVHDILSQEFAPVDPTQQHPPPRPPRRSRRSQRGRGGQETITTSQPHQSSQHEQSHISFTGGSSHQSPHQSPLHSRQHSAHQSPHHSSHQSPHHSSPTQQAFYRPIMSPQHQQSNFSFTQFSSPQTSQRQFGDSFIDFSGFQQSSLDGQSIHYTSNFLSSMFEGVAGQHQADNPAEVSVRVRVRMRLRMRLRMRMRMRLRIQDQG